MKNKPNSCPDNENILEIFLADQDVCDHEALIDHIANCPRCRVKMNLLSAVHKSGRQSKFEPENVAPSEKEKKALRKMARRELRALARERNRGKRSFFGLSAWTRWAAAAGVLIVLSAGYIAIRQTAHNDRLRSIQSSDLRLISPLGRLQEAPDSFTWTPVKNTDSYYIKLIDADLQIIFEDETHKTLWSLDPAIRAKLKKGITYLWTIEAWPDVGQLLDRKEGTFIIE